MRASGWRAFSLWKIVISPEGGGSRSSKNKSGRIRSAAASASEKLCATCTLWRGANLRKADVIATWRAPYSSDQ